MRHITFGETNDLGLSHFDNAFMYRRRSLVVDTIYPERLIYC